MAKIEESDLLKLQNLTLRGELAKRDAEIAKRDLDALSLQLNAKYDAPDGLRVTEDGTIVAPAQPLKSVPPAPLPGAEVDPYSSGLGG